MTRIAKGGGWLLGLLAAAALFLSPSASPATPPSFATGKGDPVRIEAADAILRARTRSTTIRAAHFGAALTLATTSTGCASSLTLPTEIITLAASLKCDPDLIFEYVYNTIEYEPIFGSNKGALGTLLDQRGSDADQAQLFAALLSASGFTSGQISFRYGYLRLTGAQMSSWLGVKNDGNAIANLLANGGIPFANGLLNGDGTLNRIDVAHVWLMVAISGTSYAFDPGFKQHSVATGVANLGTTLGYSQSQFLADAGGTIDSLSIRNINRAALRGDLVAYSNNLINYVKGTNPASTVNDIVGGKVIKPLTGSPLRNTTVPNLSPSQPSGFPQNWGSAIPNAYRTCFTISMPGVTPQTCATATAQTILLYADDTYGHRITVSSVPSGANFVPTLLIDGVAPPNGQSTGTALPSGSWNVNVGITHPYTGSLATSANQQRNLAINVGGTYLISAGWESVGRGMVEKHRTLLAQARAAGNAGNSEIVVGESLAVISYSWLAEWASSQRLIDNISAVTAQIHHAVGITGQATIPGQTVSGPYVDLPMNFVAAQAQTFASVSPAEIGDLLSSAGFTSSLESAVLEQTQALIPGMQAASTVRVVDTNAAAAAKTFLVDATTSAGVSSYFSSIQPSLTGYSAGDLNQIANLVSTTGTSGGSPTGNLLLLPINGAVPIGLWSGWGYSVIYQSCTGSPLVCTVGGIGQLIKGGLSGGFSGNNVPTTGSGPTLSSSTASQMPSYSGDIIVTAARSNAPSSPSNFTIAEPVDGVVGAYLYKHGDLSVGSGNQPYGLAFDRNYSSASQTTDLGLGNGWSHGFSIAAFRTSDPFTGLGDRAPTGTTLDTSSPYAASGESSAIAAAQAIAAAYVAQDLMKGTRNAQSMTIAWMVQRWQTDQLTNNAVIVRLPTSSEAFAMLPRADGSSSVGYSAPAGSAVTLTGTTLDSYGLPTVFSYLNKDRSQIQFNAVDSSGSGSIASWSMPYGMTLNFTYGYSYNGSNYLTSIYNTLGRNLSLSYSGAHVTSVADGTGRSVSYSYDSANNLTSFTDPLGNVTRFSYDTSGTYDTAGHLTQIVYPSTPGTAFVTNWYDPIGKVNKQADANGNVSNFYIAGSRTEFIDAANDRHITYQTARGRVLKDAWVLSGTANVFNSTAQSNGVVNVWSNQYDGQDRLVKAILPETGYTSYTWSADLNQNITQIVQTAKSGSSLTPLTTTFAYDPLYNKPTVVTDPRNLVTLNAYDPATGNLLSNIADANGFAAKAQFTYDAHGLPLTVTDPVGTITLNAYDGFGNLTSTTRDYGRLNQVTSFGYDGVGNAVSVTDPQGNVTVSAYDAARQLTSAILPAAPQTLVTAYSYDADGRVIQASQSADGAVLRSTSSTYTPSGKVATATDANGDVTRNGYDVVDRLASVTDPAGNVTSYAYDTMSRQTGIFNAAIQAGALVTRSYTPDGLLASVADATHPATTYAYNGLDQLKTTTYPGSTTETYAYDADGNVVTRTTRKGDTLSFGYDTLNRLCTKTISTTATSCGGTSASPLTNYSYDLVGRSTGISDNSASIAAVSATASYAATYSYDALNRPITASWTPTVVQTAPTQAGVTFTHSYDANNRRVGQAASDNSWLLYPATTGTTSYTANNLNQYTAVGGASPTYDNNGNLTFDGTVTYCYDVEGRLTRAITAGTCASPTTTLGAYAFDAQGRRKSKTAGGTTTITVTDADNREVLEYDGTSGAIQRWYAYGAGSNDVLGQMNVAAATRTTLVPDIQGSFIASMASNATTFSKANFLPYGENAASTSGTFRYTGSRIDPETVATSQPSGIYYMRARAYSPQWGRFIQVDPIGYQGGINLYAYTGNDPLNQTDPDGLCPWCIGAGIGVGFEIVKQVATPSDRAAWSQGWNALTQGDVFGAISATKSQIGNLAVAAGSGAIGGEILGGIQKSAVISDTAKTVYSATASAFLGGSQQAASDVVSGKTPGSDVIISAGLSAAGGGLGHRLGVNAAEGTIGVGKANDIVNSTVNKTLIGVQIGQTAAQIAQSNSSAK